MTSSKKALLVGCAVAALCWIEPAIGQTRTFNVPAEDAVKAIPEFARQAGIQIVAPGDQLKGVQTPAINGSMDLHAALSQLLDHTGIEIASDDGQTIILRARSKNAEAASNDGAANHPALETVIVTGTNIEGNRNLSVPITTITRDQIKQTGLMTTQELLATVPQNFGDITPASYEAVETGSTLQQANSENVTAVDLRGLGAESTLTLVNGARQAGSLEGRVLDVSNIPLAAIDRIDIVTGGESAIYGSDAVAGVVNIVTRRSFDGAEVQGSYGAATNHAGGAQSQFSAIAGIDDARFGGLIAYDISNQGFLDLAKTGYLDHTTSDELINRLDILPQSARRSLLGTAHFDPTDSIDIYTDVSYSTNQSAQTANETLFLLTSNPSIFVSHSSTDIFNADVGIKKQLGSWGLDLRAYTGFAHNTQSSLGVEDAGIYGVFPINEQTRNGNSLNTISFKASGDLPDVFGIDPRLALSAEARHETLNEFDTYAGTAVRHRTVESGSAELLLPIVEDGQSPLLNLLQVTLAGRYDNYSDVGDTFNPNAGVVWKPGKELTFRGDYATSFRAPALADLLTSNTVLLQNRFDPTANKDVPVLIWEGANPDIRPETAKTWSGEFDYEPLFLKDTKFSVTYFDVHYTGRINMPAPGTGQSGLILENESLYGSLIQRSPSAAYLQSIIATNSGGAATLASITHNSTGIPWNPSTQSIQSAFPGLIVFDNRVHNIGVEDFQGIDFGGETHWDVADGDLSAQLHGTYTLDHYQEIIAGGPALPLENEIGLPVSLRMRGSVGYAKDAFSGFLFVNYVNGYKDPYSQPTGTMSAWTTVDLSLVVDGSQLTDVPELEGFDLTLGVQNLLDNGPPRFRNGSLDGLGYDATNASPVGRFITIRISKTF